MKILGIICFIAAVVLIASSCKKSDSPGHHITASFRNGNTFSANGSYVTTSGATGAQITIEGIAVTGAKMHIILNPYTAMTGTFAVSNAGTGSRCEYIPPSGAPVHFSTQGIVTLTSLSPDIVGTFKFITTDSNIFTGSFSAPTP